MLESAQACQGIPTLAGSFIRDWKTRCIVSSFLAMVIKVHSGLFILCHSIHESAYKL